MKVLVTGGAGFIGSHLVDRLLQGRHEVITIDNFMDYYSPEIKKKNIEHNIENKKFTLVKDDIRNEEILKTTLRDVEIVFHLAAIPGVRYSIENPFIYHDINATGTLKLLDACLNSDIKAFIYSSSSSIYGDPQHLPIDENHPTMPISPYGASKLAAEKYCLVFHKNYGLPVIILRYFTVYGPRQRPDMAINKFCKLILNNKQPEIYGDGKQSRDFTFVSDIIDGTMFAAKSKKTVGEILNLGSGKMTNVNELIEMIAKILGKKISPVYTEAKKGDVSHTWANIEKARKILNYDPKVNLEGGINLFVKWFKSHTNYFT